MSETSVPGPAEVWITGIGLASSLGEGLDANWDALNAGRINVDETNYAPYVVHPWVQGFAPFVFQQYWKYLDIDLARRAANGR